jgi:hypothetical protein
MPRSHRDIGFVDPVLKGVLIIILAPLAIAAAVALGAMIVWRLGWW